MANICDNTFYATSVDENNIKYIKNFLQEEFDYIDIYEDSDFIEAYFESRWVFPENIMKDMFEGIPNKNDIFMRCLSVEYGDLYHALWVCENEEGWIEV